MGGTLFFSANIDNNIQQEMDELKSEINNKNIIIEKLTSENEKLIKLNNSIQEEQVESNNNNNIQQEMDELKSEINNKNNIMDKLTGYNEKLIKLNNSIQEEQVESNNNIQ